jgi:transposase-like protein
MVEKGSKSSKARLVPNGHYDKQFISKVVSEVLQGKPKRVVQLKYGLKRTTLNKWLKSGDLAVDPRHVGPRVSIDLKRTVVRSVTSGRLSMREAMVTYGVKTSLTIEKWIKELEQENTDLVASNEAWMKKNKSNKKDITQSNPDVKALQKALEDAQLKILALNTLIDVAEEQLKINIRKKPGAKQSNG